MAAYPGILGNSDDIRGREYVALCPRHDVSHYPGEMTRVVRCRLLFSDVGSKGCEFTNDVFIPPLNDLRLIDDAVSLCA